MNFNAIKRFRLFSITVASFHFTPGVISSLLTAVLLYIMISLGYWQLDRANYKDTLQQKIQQRKSLIPAGLDELSETREQRRYLPVKFFGEYDTRHSFLLDNKINNGRVGYHVYTPVQTNSSALVLVNRGFIPLGETREQLPDLDTPNAKIEFRGLLDLTPSRALVLADNLHTAEHWPMVLQYVDLAELSKILGKELYDMVLWLDQEQPGSFEYDLPVLNLNAAKNNGYAFQWFALSLALLLIYITVNTKRKSDN